MLQFFTGNTGLHHVHHLSARIPNYNLQRAHDENPIFHDVPTLSVWDGVRAVRLKLWDEDRGRLVTLRGGAAAGPVAVQAMADRDDLEFTYSLIDRIFRLSLGELADFSAAKYDGDFSLSLEEAQRRKHEYVAEQIGIGPGRRVLDLGCGWGPLLDFVRRRGGTGVGVTLSSAQAAACRRHGLDVHLHDARAVTRQSFGPFDAVANVGAFEHFCSVEEHRAGRQDEIYSGLFARVASLLPKEAGSTCRRWCSGRT